jgi:hypothetical protein
VSIPAPSPEVKAILRAWFKTDGPERLKKDMEKDLPRVMAFFCDLKKYGMREATRRHPWAEEIIKEVEARRATH